MGSSKKPNKREFFRVYIEEPLSINITKIGNVTLDLHERGTIQNISAGGLEFISNLDVQIKKGILVEVGFVILGNPFRLNGDLVRKLETKKETRYGLKFIISDRGREELLEILFRVETGRPNIVENEE
jgi:c-di-GMP-binding flagellar brake protein YcgR